MMKPGNDFYYYSFLDGRSSNVKSRVIYNLSLLETMQELFSYPNMPSLLILIPVNN